MSDCELHVGPGTERVVADVLLERQAQDARFGGPASDDRREPAEWVALLLKHLARVAGTDDDDARRGHLVRVAALAVAAVESLDRRACGTGP